MSALYHLRNAGAEDLDACLRLRRAVEGDFRRRGIDQWVDPEAGDRAIRKWIDLSAMFVARDDVGEVVGCFAINGPDLDFWTPEEARDPALYWYKLMIHPEHRGTGLGDTMLSWTCQYAAGQGARWLRVDCWRTNDDLHKYMIRRGFTHVATREAPGRRSGWLAQRPTSLPLPLPVSCRAVVVDETDPGVRPVIPEFPL